LREKEVLHRFYPETIELIHAKEAEYEQVVLVKVVVNHPKYLPESIEMITPVIIELLTKYQIPPGRYGGVARKLISVQICSNFAVEQWILCK
jgi:hypothetical protein